MLLVDHRARRAVGLPVAGALLLAVALASLALGNRGIAPGTVLDALIAYDPGNFDHVVVITQRLPRTLLGLGVGAALGLGGALMQALTRNPLADPGLLGVNAGASLAIVAAVSLLGLTSPASYVWPAMLGAAVAAVVVHRLGSAGVAGSDPVRLVLAGTVITALIESGLVKAFLVLDPRAFDSFRAWDVGSLSGRDLDSVVQIAPFLVVGIVLALALSRPMNALALGDDVAAGLGARIGVTRAICLATITLLCGAATAAAGPVAFVGLVVPFVVRMFTGPHQGWILTYSALLAPVLLLGSDVLARIALGDDTELPVGLMTALIGAPVFIALVRRRKVAKL